MNIKEDVDVYIVFDKSMRGDASPFYIREGIGMGVTFQDLNGCLSGIAARKKAKEMGFGDDLEIVTVEGE